MKITTKSVEFTDANGSLKFEVSSSGGLVVSCAGGQPWELTDEQTMQVYVLLDQAIVADKWIGASDPSPEDFDRRVTEAFAPKPGTDLREVPSVREEERKATVRVEAGDFGNIVVRGSSWDSPAVPRQVAGDFVRNTP